MTRRRLDAELVRRRLVGSRTAAQRAIESGLVRVEGVAQPRASSLVGSSAAVQLLEPPDRYVGRGGRKLEGALAEFEITVAGRRAVDIGASTGGFTDCLLQHGAAHVVAVDVGYGQLDWRLRTNSRVTVVERTNIRHAAPDFLGAPFDVVVADLSFISLRTVASQLAALGSPLTDYVLLVKPQFEVGRDQVGKGGVVRSPGLHRWAIAAVDEALAAAGIGSQAAMASPLQGGRGNREFFIWARPGQGILDEAAITRAVAEEGS